MGALRRTDIDAERILLMVNQLTNTPDFSSSELQQIFGMAPMPNYQMPARSSAMSACREDCPLRTRERALPNFFRYRSAWRLA